MNHLEFSELLGCEGKLNYGEKVWICDYRFNDVSEKAIRHLPPQEVILVNNSELPKNKTVYYSNFHFRPLGKKGNVLSKIISPYDNTGYRSYTGVSINIFLTKEECIKFYINQCHKIKDDIALEKERVQKRFSDLAADIIEKMREVELI